MMTETALHAQRHKRVLASRSRIALKARRDATLRSEALNKQRTSARWFNETAAKMQRNAAKAFVVSKQQPVTKPSWLSRAAAFIRRGR